MTTYPEQPPPPRWRKSSYSDGGPSNCVEVADDFPAVVPVRDSKAPDHVLIVPATAWQAFIDRVKAE